MSVVVRRAAYSSADQGTRKLKRLMRQGLVQGVVMVAKLKHGQLGGLFVHESSMSDAVAIMTGAMQPKSAA